MCQSRLETNYKRLDLMMSLGLHKMFIALINGILPTFLIRQINKTFFGIYYDIKQTHAAYVLYAFENIEK
jgi:hypothetical protein